MYGVCEQFAPRLNIGTVSTLAPGAISPASPGDIARGSLSSSSHDGIRPPIARSSVLLLVLAISPRPLIRRSISPGRPTLGHRAFNLWIRLSKKNSRATPIVTSPPASAKPRLVRNLHRCTGVSSDRSPQSPGDECGVADGPGRGPT